jgi:Icc-related predicted phosphoesterase
MNIVMISDTHTQHEKLGTLSGDVLIHCGDGGLGRDADWAQVEQLDTWFGRQAFKVILCTGGNHDFALEAASSRRLPLFKNAIFLEDEEFHFGGVKFYGAPWVPELRDWAFYQSGPALCERWALIPEDTEVLITHTPPFGILDANSTGRFCGCTDLRKRVDALQLKLHCFGHIHASAGQMRYNDTMYVNASMVNRAYQLAREPVFMELS